MTGNGLQLGFEISIPGVREHIIKLTGMIVNSYNSFSAANVV
jgi:hypothetical protein